MEIYDIVSEFIRLDLANNVEIDFKRINILTYYYYTSYIIQNKRVPFPDNLELKLYGPTFENLEDDFNNIKNNTLRKNKNDHLEKSIIIDAIYETYGKIPTTILVVIAREDIRNILKRYDNVSKDTILQYYIKEN